MYKKYCGVEVFERNTSLGRLLQSTALRGISRAQHFSKPMKNVFIFILMLHIHFTDVQLFLIHFEPF